MLHVYGWQHIVYLIVFFGAFAGSLAAILLKVKNEKILREIIRGIGGFLFVLIVWNRIAICIHRNDWWALIPDSFCGISSFCLSICAMFLKRDSLPFHCLCYIAFWGGAITTFYPDFLGQNPSFFYPATISGLLHHGVGFYLSTLMLATGYVKPSLKKFYAFPVGLCIFMVYGLFLIDALKFEHAMYIGTPLVKGTFLTWYVVAAMLIAVTLAGVYGYEYFMKKNAAKKTQEQNGALPDEREAQENALPEEQAETRDGGRIDE